MIGYSSGLQQKVVHHMLHNTLATTVDVLPPHHDVGVSQKRTIFQQHMSAHQIMLKRLTYRSHPTAPTATHSEPQTCTEAASKSPSQADAPTHISANLPFARSTKLGDIGGAGGFAEEASCSSSPAPVIMRIRAECQPLRFMLQGKSWKASESTTNG